MVRRPVRMVLRLSLLLLMLGGLASPASSALPVSPLSFDFHGQVTDEAGEAIAGATLSDGDQVATTDAEGRYRLPEQLPGTYVLRASADCYASTSKQAMVLVPADREVDFQLESTCS